MPIAILVLTAAAAIAAQAGRGLRALTQRASSAAKNLWRPSVTVAQHAKRLCREAVVIRGANVFAGYWSDPTATEQSLKAGWHDTGDLMRRGEGNDLWFVSRKKDIIVRGGTTMSPIEVEEALVASHPAVEEAAMLPVMGSKSVMFIDFSNRYPARHAGALTNLWVCAKPRQVRVARTERWLRSGRQCRPTMLQSRRVPGTRRSRNGTRDPVLAKVVPLTDRRQRSVRVRPWASSTFHVSRRCLADGIPPWFPACPRLVATAASAA